jgi:transcriptional regulator with PAS, ATPase and Fis domain
MSRFTRLPRRRIDLQSGIEMTGVTATADKLEHLVFQVAQGMSARPGEGFFQSLVRSLAEALNADFVLVGALSPDSKSVVTLAVHGDGREAPKLEYRLAGSPCENVIHQNVCTYPSGVTRLFPADALLAELNIEGYSGCPLTDSNGQCVGLIAALTRAPLQEPRLAESLLQIFAMRASIELERKQQIEALERSQERLRTFVAHSTEGVIRLGLERNIPRGAPVEQAIEMLYRYGYIADCNDQAAQLFGRASAPELIGARFEAISPRNDPAQLARVRSGVASKDPSSQSERIVNGRSLILTRIPIVTGDEVIGGWITVRDVTELKEASEQVERLNVELRNQVQALQRSEERLRGFVTHSNEGIVRLALEKPIPLDLPDEDIVDWAYKYAYVEDCNDQAATIFGRNRSEDLIGARLETVSPRADGGAERVRSALRAASPSSEAERKIGERSFLVTRFLNLQDGSLVGSWQSVRDVTELKEASIEVERLNAELQQRVTELTELKSRLERDNAYLLEEIRVEHNFEGMVGEGPRFRAMIDHVRRVAPTSEPVLIQGETGTGKELVARSIHNLSPRHNRPLVKINCAAISAGLVESELFGHVKGAFTGATERRIGRFEYANGGTLFLDEVGELPLEMQAKLLRVLQEQEFEPVGSNRSVKVDVRVLAATNRDLAQTVREGRFRSDLYYRLLVVPVDVPPLRERREDIPALARHFMEQLARRLGRNMTGISADLMQRMVAYDWPGNIRELENFLARAMVLSQHDVLEDAMLPDHPLEGQRAPASLADAQKRHVESALDASGWVIEGPKGAAGILKMHPSTLRSLMKRLGIVRK